MNPPETIDWSDLLLRTISGDSAARERLFEMIQVRLMPVIQYRLRGWSEQDHEDILQNALVVVFEKLEGVESNPHQFALTVLRNKIGDALRSHGRSRKLSISPTGVASNEGGEDLGGAGQMSSEDSDFTSVLENRDLINTIRQAIRKLSPFCRALFLALLEQRAVGEVWEMYSDLEPNLKRSTFDKRVFDCRKKLRLLVATAS